MTILALGIYVDDKKRKFPDLAEEIRDLYTLCIDEIQDGGSEENETNLCYDSIEDLIKEYKN